MRSSVAVLASGDLQGVLARVIASERIGVIPATNEKQAMLR
jgi:hypothetical protein